MPRACDIWRNARSSDDVRQAKERQLRAEIAEARKASEAAVRRAEAAEKANTALVKRVEALERKGQQQPRDRDRPSPSGGQQPDPESTRQLVERRVASRHPFVLRSRRGREGDGHAFVRANPSLCGSDTPALLARLCFSPPLGGACSRAG